MWPRTTRVRRVAIGASLVVAAMVAARAQVPAQTARVTGRLSTPDGKLLLSGAVTIVPVADLTRPVALSEVRIFPDGAFSFGGIPPGVYQIRARGQTQTNGAALFATFRVEVAGRDISNVEMTLKPGAMMTGQVVIDTPRRSKARNPLPSIMVRAPLIDGSDFGDALTGRVERDGSFTIRGLSLGAHHLMLAGLADDWRIKSVLLRGRDVTDQAFDVDGDQPMRDMLVTLTQEFSRLDGRVLDAHGAPAAGVRVVVFSSVPAFWIPGGRRLRVIQTDADGRFSVKGLPAGAYLAVALPSPDGDRAVKPRDLERLRTIATEFTLASEHAVQTLDLGLARDPSAPTR